MSLTPGTLVCTTVYTLQMGGGPTHIKDLFCKTFLSFVQPLDSGIPVSVTIVLKLEELHVHLQSDSTVTSPAKTGATTTPNTTTRKLTQSPLLSRESTGHQWTNTTRTTLGPPRTTRNPNSSY